MNSVKSDWLDISNLDIAYENKEVVRKIDLRLSIGENTVLIGANGSGKTTLIKTICRIKYPIAKQHSYLKIFNSSKINIWELRKNIGFVFSEIDGRIKKHMLVEDVILSGYQGTFGIINKKIITDKQRDYMNYIIEKLELKGINNCYSKLSDGLKRRVLIARSIVNKPKVLILDEPTSMLDIKSKYILLDTLEKLSQEGITLFYVTNDIENIIKNVDRVIFLKQGKIIADGKPKDIITSKNISNLYNYNLEIINSNGYWRTAPKEKSKNKY